MILSREQAGNLYRYSVGGGGTCEPGGSELVSTVTEVSTLSDVVSIAIPNVMIRETVVRNVDIIDPFIGG